MPLLGERGKGPGANDERDTTVNQFLAEMDGFYEDSEPIIVIAATNHSKKIDPAAKRSGRFGKEVIVELPQLQEREGIFRVHLRKCADRVGRKVDEILSNNVDLELLAKSTMGFSGAEIGEVVNRASMCASE